MQNRALKQVGQAIRVQRIRRGLSQQDLATMVRLSRASINNIEAGRQNVAVLRLQAIAKALRVPAGALV